MDVRKMREESKMTRQEFSEYLGIPRKTIRNWEQGATKPVNYLLTLMEKVLRYEGKIDWKEHYV